MQKNWLDEYLNELNTFDLQDPKNLPASNVKEKSPFDQSPLGKWYNSQPSLPSFDERIKQMKSTSYDAAGNKVIPSAPQRKPTSSDLAAYSGNLDFLGLAQPKEENLDKPSPTRPVSKPLNPAIVKHLMSKKDTAKTNEEVTAPLSDDIVSEKVSAPSLLERFSPEEYAKAKSDADERNDGLGWAQFAAGVGNSLARRNPNEVNSTFDKIRERNKDETVGEFNRQKASAISDIDIKGKIEDNDPNSRKSKLIQDTISRLYPGKFSPESIASITAKDSDLVLKPLELNAKLEENRINNSFKNQEMSLRKAEITNEKLNKLQTQFGIANTEADAKNLKDAYEEKSNFDSKIQEMIKLREDNHGGALFNREDVARGKQLSKDLLLSYKNMAKLGVLSVSDEKILNQIIPADPLEYNSPLSAMQGQDPILHTLKTFQSDKNKEFNTKVATRIRGGNTASNNPTPSNEVERKTKDGRIAIFDSNSKEFLRYK